MGIISHYSLYEFMGNFKTVLSNIREKENILDHNDLFVPPKVLTPLAIEKNLLGVYTS